MLYFSPSTCGFYDTAISGVIPKDAVEITDGERQAALDALAPGTRIAGGSDGKPVVVAIEITATEALARLRRRRDGLLRDSDHTQLADAALSDAARAAWAIYRQQLRDLPALADADTGQVAWPTPPASKDFA